MIMMNPMKKDSSFTDFGGDVTVGDSFSLLEQFLPSVCDETAAASKKLQEVEEEAPQVKVLQESSTVASMYDKKDLSKVKLPFPWKLHQLLEDLETDGKEHIACWVQGGMAFRILAQEEFANDVMQNYFRQSKYTSFIRQLYIYGFCKVESGPQTGAYHHPLFQKHNKSLCLTLGRNQITKDRRCKKTPGAITKKTVIAKMNGKNKAATRKVSNPFALPPIEHIRSSSTFSSAVQQPQQHQPVTPSSFTIDGTTVPDLTASYNATLASVPDTTNTTSSSSSSKSILSPTIFDLSKFFDTSLSTDEEAWLNLGLDLEPRRIEDMMMP